MNFIRQTILFASLAFLLNACSTTTPELSGLSPQAQAEIIKKYGGIYKVGNPYQIGDKWYYPKEDYNYSEVGVASWYGEDFHGNQTANGEHYDMNTLTAAHRTLPLPSIVRVTNLQNGKSIVLRVNDRGPYVKDRIIDLSKRGAQLLGYMGQGTTKVKVEIMKKESIALKNAMLNLNAGNTQVADNYVPAHSLYESTAERKIIAEQETERVSHNVLYETSVDDISNNNTKQYNNRKSTASTSDADLGKYYIQVASFKQYDLAHQLLVRLKEYGKVHIVNVNVNNERYYRVSVGPFSYDAEARVTLAKLRYNGMQDARIEKK